MTERTPQTKGVLRVFGYDPEAPAEDPTPAPSVGPVWSQQDIEDFIKGMSGPWFIPPCLRPEPPPSPDPAVKMAEEFRRILRGEMSVVGGDRLALGQVWVGMDGHVRWRQ